MASTISAGTTTTTALSYSADTSGVLQLQTNGGTTAVTIDTNQNVGVGVTPSAWGSSWGKAIQVGSNYAAFANHSSNTIIGNNWYNNGTNDIYANNGYAVLYQQTGGVHSWYNAASGTAGNAITFTQAMTLDASSNLLVGKTSSGQVLTPGFEYNNTSAQQYLSICNNTAGNTALYVANNGTSGTRQLVQFYAGSSACGSITWNGTIIALNQPSDQRLKENIVDSGSGLAKLNNIKIRSFDWKESGLHTDFGVIAQELETVAPESVTQGEDNEDDSIKRYWGVNTSALIPAMIKAIQELSAQVTTLQTQVTALKG